MTRLKAACPGGGGGAIGLYQINLQIPANAPNGDLLLSVSQDGVNSNVVIVLR